MLKRKKTTGLNFENQTAFGQVTIEFTFCVIIILLMVYGLIMVFRWTGVDLAERRIAHEKELIKPITEAYDPFLGEFGPMEQVDPYFYRPAEINAVWSGY